LFSYDRERVIEFCKQLGEFRKTVLWDIRWCCSLRVDNVDEELLKAMKDSGCYMICLGLESYSSIVLKSMKKHITPQQIKTAIEMITNNGMGVQGTFIFGDTAETLETASETLTYYRYNIDAIRDAVGLGFIIPFPGSEIYKRCILNGVITNEYELIQMREKKGLDFFNPMNLTDTLTDKEFAGLVDEVMTTAWATGHFVVPKRVGNGLQFECPYCHKESTIYNINPFNQLDVDIAMEDLRWYRDIIWLSDWS
jgi:radical SAM superfamily enzyme YgiQ (UPF0313 family)